MTNFIPASPTLADISTNDRLTYKGKDYAIDTVVSTTTHVGGTITTVVEITYYANTVRLTLESKNTVLSSYHIDSDDVYHATWVQTVNA